MKIVIDIPEEAYNLLQNEGVDWLGAEHILDAVANGMPLPKGHGDLIDRNQIEYLKAIHDMKYGKITASECATKIKYSAPTIIKADN